MTHRFCRDCTHHEAYRGGHYCNAPGAVRQDPVTGETEYLYATCQAARQDEQACGGEAKWFMHDIKTVLDDETKCAVCGRPMREHYTHSYSGEKLFYPDGLKPGAWYLCPDTRGPDGLIQPAAPGPC